MNIKRKGFISLLLCMAMILTVMFQPSTAHAEEKAVKETGTVQYQLIDDISQYRGATKTAPDVPAGYVFAGWYEKDSTNLEFGGYSPLDEEKANAIGTGSAYAKFVDENVLRVKFQIENGTTNENELTKLRMITTVDSLAYSSVGFEVSFNGTKVDAISTKVYKTVHGYTSDGEKLYTPSESFACEISKYFMSYIINNIPNQYFNDSFTITPKWKTLDGTVVTGSTRETRIQDVYIQKFNAENIDNNVMHRFHGAGVSMADLEGKALQFEFQITSDTGKFDFDFMDDKQEWANITGTIVIEKKDGKVTSNIGQIVETGNGWYAWKLNSDLFAGDGAAKANIVDLFYQQSPGTWQGNILINWGSLKAVEPYDVRDLRANKYTSETEFYKEFEQNVITKDELTGKALHLEFKFTTETGKFGFDVMDKKDWANITGNGADKVIIEKTSKGIDASMGRIIALENDWYAWELNSDEFKGNGWTKGVVTGVGVFYHQGVVVTGEVLVDWDSLKVVDAYDDSGVHAKQYKTGDLISENLSKVVSLADLKDKVLQFEFKIPSETGEFRFVFTDRDNGNANISGWIWIKKANNKVTIEWDKGKIEESGNGWYKCTINDSEINGNEKGKAANINCTDDSGLPVQGEVWINWDSLKVVEPYDVRDLRANKYTSETEFYKEFDQNVITKDELNGKALHLEFKFTTETGKFGFDVMDKSWENITGNGSDKVIIEKTSDGIVTTSMGRIVELGNEWYAWELNSSDFNGNGWVKAAGVGLFYHQSVSVEGEVLVDWDSLSTVEAYSL